MQEQEKQIIKLAGMLGNKLDEGVQSMVKTLLTGIMLETNFDRLKSLMNTLLEKLEADKLPTETQNVLMEKILDVVQFIRDGEDWKIHVEDFKWDSTAPVIITEAEIPKSNFRWPNTELDTKVKQVKKDDYPWRDKEKVHLI
jgi:hypothetical protein